MVCFTFRFLATGKPLLPSQKAPTVEYSGTIRILDNYASGEGVQQSENITKSFNIRCSSVNIDSLKGQFWLSYGAFSPMLDIGMEKINGTWCLIPNGNSELDFSEISLQQEQVVDDI